MNLAGCYYYENLKNDRKLAKCKLELKEDGSFNQDVTYEERYFVLDQMKNRLFFNFQRKGKFKVSNGFIQFKVLHHEEKVKMPKYPFNHEKLSDMKDDSKDSTGSAFEGKLEENSFSVWIYDVDIGKMDEEKPIRVNFCRDLLGLGVSNDSTENDNIDRDRERRLELLNQRLRELLS